MFLILDCVEILNDSLTAVTCLGRIQTLFSTDLLEILCTLSRAEWPKHHSIQRHIPVYIGHDRSTHFPSSLEP